MLLFHYNNSFGESLNSLSDSILIDAMSELVTTTFSLLYCLSSALIQDIIEWYSVNSDEIRRLNISSLLKPWEHLDKHL